MNMPIWQPDVVVLRFGEWTLKGRNRSKFQKSMKSRIKSLLSPFPHIRIQNAYSRVYLHLNNTPYGAVRDQLHLLFGLTSFSPAKLCGRDVDTILQAAVEVMGQLREQPDSFKVAVKRADKSFAMPSPEMTQLVAKAVLQAHESLTVNLHQPHKTLAVDIRTEGVYVYIEVEQGPGGLPAGVSGKGLLMLSGGIDSPAAGWLAIKRGVALEIVHFHSYPYTSERAQQKAIDLTQQLAQYIGFIKLHMVKLTDIQLLIEEQVPSNLGITLLRRTMIQMAEAIADQQKALALINGDSLGQVASQTLGSLRTIGDVSTLPLLRPLITMDKVEITKLAKQIGTYDISIRPYDDCCTLFAPLSPSTNPNRHITRKIQNSLKTLPQAMEQAVAEMETLTIKANQNHVVDFDINKLL